jgi:hypothetical protein
MSNHPNRSKFLPYDPTAIAPRVLVRRSDGNEIIAVRLINPDGTEKWTRTFRDSRLANSALREAFAELS